MRSTLVLLLASLTTPTFALPGPRKAPQHHHHVRRDDDVVYATVQVTQYITMTAGNDDAAVPTTTSRPSFATVQAAGNVASAVAPTTMATSTSSSVAVAETSSTAEAATASSTTTSTSTSSGTKRGLAWPGDNPSSMTSLFSNSALGWYFNWGTSATSGLSSTFIPNQWGANNLDNVAKISSGSTLLGFNEPDHAGQAAMSASQAASYYKQYMTPLRQSGQIARLGSPAITNAATGITWLTEFMSLCSDCEIDFVAAHWYGPSMDLLQSQMIAIKSAFNLPVWITEMGCTEWSAASNPSNDEIETFMKSAIAWMEGESWIERYAWFGAMIITDASLGAGNSLVTSDGSSLSSLGQIYLGQS